MATIGTAVKNGIELARSERPELFEHVSFSYEDDRFDAKQSLTAYRELRLKQKLTLLLGFGTVLAQAIAPLTERDKLPFINFNFEAAPVVGKQYVIRSMNYTDQYMLGLANYLTKTGAGQFPIIRADATYFEAMTASLVRALRPGAAVTEVAVVPPDMTDFRAIIAKLSPYQHRQFGIFLWPEQLIAFLRQAQELNFQAEYFGTDLCETAATLSGGAELLEGCIYPDNDASSDFRERYRQRFGNEAQLTFAASAYDMTLLAVETLRRRPAMSSEEFLAALASVQSREGVLGRFSYREEKEAGKYFEYPVRVKRIAGRRGVAVQ